MSPASRWCRLAALVVVTGMLALGVVFSGCSQAPSPEPKEPSTPGGQLEPGGPEPGPKPEQKPEQKPEPKLEPKPEQKPEPKPEPEPQPKPGPGPNPSGTDSDVKVSSFAPAEDLVGQVAEYIAGLEKAVENEEEYKASVEKIAKDSNTLILIALALGMHDQDNKYKAAAGVLMKAAQDLAVAKDYASAKKAVAAITKAAAAETGPATKLKWEKVASLPETMKKVPLISNKLKLRVKRVERRVKECRGDSAVLAVIAEGSIANAGDTDKPEEVQKWRQYCVQMREAAAAVNGAVRALDKEAITAGMAKLQQSCDDCHAVFHPEELQKE